MSTLQVLESLAVTAASIVGIVVGLRLWTICKLFFDRTRLVNALETAIERNKEKDEQIHDLTQAATAAKTGQDAWRDEVVRLNAKIDHLENIMRDLSSKLDVTMRKYEVAIEHIAAPTDTLPAAISDDVHRARLRHTP